jgi:hypothetical protein
MFTAVQEPDVKDPLPMSDSAPGAIRLCIQLNNQSSCAPAIRDPLARDADRDVFSESHFLETAEVVYPRGTVNPALLHLQVGSFYSGDGDQRKSSDFVAYNARSRRFDVVFHHQLGGNHNEEVRFISSGPLKGSIVTVDSPYGPPFSYLVTVNRLTSDYHYRQVLRYRSATRYNDGNPLAVIDSEMPNILRRLDFWHPRNPLPLPKSGCAHPHLVKTELWCS